MADLSTGPGIEADGLFSVEYSCKRIGNMATGFSLRMDGPDGSLAGKKTVFVKVPDGSSGVIGSDKGEILSTGKSLKEKKADGVQRRMEYLASP